MDLRELYINDPVLARRTKPIWVRDTAGNGVPADLTGSQPTAYKNGVSLGNTAGTLQQTSVAMGAYRLEILTQAQLAACDPGDVIRVLFDTGTTSPIDESYVVGIRPESFMDSLGSAGGAGGAASITLPTANASTVNDFYKGAQIFVYAGTGADQPPRDVAGYVGATRVLTPSVPFSPALDATSKIVIDRGGQGLDAVAQLLATVLSGSYPANSVGERLQRAQSTAAGLVVDSVTANVTAAIVAAMQANGTTLKRLSDDFTTAVAQKLARMLVDSGGNVTSSNPGGLNGTQDTALSQIRTIIDTVAASAASADGKLPSNAVTLLGRLTKSLDTLQTDLLAALPANESWQDPVAAAAPDVVTASIEVRNAANVVIGHRSVTRSAAGRTVAIGPMGA